MSKSFLIAGCSNKKLALEIIFVTKNCKSKTNIHESGHIWMISENTGKAEKKNLSGVSSDQTKQNMGWVRSIGLKYKSPGELPSLGKQTRNFFG